MIGHDLAAVRAQIGDQRVGDVLRAAARVGPAVAGVGVRGEEEAGCRGADRRQRGVRVREHPGDERVRLFGRERAAPEARAELQRAQAEPQGRDRMPRHPQQLRAGEIDHAGQVGAQRAHHGEPGRLVAAEIVCGALDVAPGDRGPAAVQRLGVGDLGGDPLDALAQPEGAEERRAQRRRVDGRSDVMAEAGKRELRGADAAADRRGGLEHAHVVAGAGERDGSRRARWARCPRSSRAAPWPQSRTDGRGSRGCAVPPHRRFS